MEAIGPLTACLEKAHKGKSTVKDAVPMIRIALLLMGDAAQNHATLRRKTVLQHLNPQVRTTLSEGERFQRGTAISQNRPSQSWRQQQH